MKQLYRMTLAEAKPVLMQDFRSFFFTAHPKMCLHGINTLALIHETWVTVYCKMLTHLYVNNPIDLEMNAMIFSCVGFFLQEICSACISRIKPNMHFI